MSQIVFWAGQIVNWPPKQPYQVFQKPDDDGTATAIGCPDGRLVFEVYDPSNELISSFTTPRLEFTGGGRHFVAYAYLDNLRACYIDFENVPSDAEHDGILVFDAPTGNLSSTPSIEDPNSIPNCQLWIQNRQAKFLKRPKPRTQHYRRPKSKQEQLDDLYGACGNLRVLVDQVREGRMFLTGQLAVVLRALLYWEKDTSGDHTYNPLLLRLASKKNLPLPVWAQPPFKQTPTLQQASYFSTGSMAHPKQRDPLEQLVDLQDWLLYPVVFINRGGASVGISARDLIAETANAIGSAHYDEDVSEYIDTLQALQSNHRHFLSDFMCQTADTTIELSLWVLDELSRPPAWR